MPDAFIGLGSNQGDPPSNIRRALAALAESPGVEVRNVSPIYRSAPVGDLLTADFANAAASLKTSLSPGDLLDLFEEIERRFGREKAGGPPRDRAIDLDLLLYDDLVLDSGRLIVPHPRMFERNFVLQPLAAIAPGVVDPAGGKTIAERLAELGGAPLELYNKP